MLSSPQARPVQFPSSLYVLLKSIVHSYAMRKANSSNAITNNLFELFLDILADDKYHIVETSLNCIMNLVVHDDMVSIIKRLQLFNSCSETAADTGCHNK